MICETLPISVKADLKTDFPKLPIERGDSKIYFQDCVHVKEAKGFKSSHFPPTNYSKTSEGFIQTAFLENIGEELQIVYQGTKDVFNIRRKDIKKNNQSGKGIIENEKFNFEVNVNQGEHNPVMAKISRKIEILDKANTLLAQIYGVEVH